MGPNGGVNPYILIGMMCVVGVVPLVVGFATAYLKLSIVLGTVRNALGGQQVPGQLVTSALALVLTLIVMEPTLDATFERVESLKFDVRAAHPIREGRTLFERAGGPWVEFLSRHTGARELEGLRRLYKSERASGGQGTLAQGEPPLAVLLGAFMLTELREAFVMACVLLVPFVVIDLVIANLLVGLGMFMVSPVMISLPVKLAAFCAIDGWVLLAEALILSYRGG
ncbi:MAG: hypothetical protein RL417_223 [Pseudomonadota bacterium]|jgi:type III secretion protein R